MMNKTIRKNNIKVAISVLLLCTSIVLSFCSCDKEKKITAKEGAEPGIAIIGDYTITLLGDVKYQNIGAMRDGLYPHLLTADIEIRNDSDETVSYYDLMELGLYIGGNEGADISSGFYCGEMKPGNLSESIEPGTSKEISLVGSEGSYGGSKELDHQQYGNPGFNIEIIFNQETITTKHFAN